jgi:hypothetical protein
MRFGIQRAKMSFYDFVSVILARNEIEDKVGNKVKGMHEEIVDPWEDEDWPTKPKFRVGSNILFYPYLIFVEMEAEPAEATKFNLSVWQLLDRGTETRPMHLSGEDHPDGEWMSKTAPRQLFSGPGGGVTTGIWEPYDEGIEEREFADAVGEAVELYADQIVMDAYEKILDRYFSQKK